MEITKEHFLNLIQKIKSLDEKALIEFLKIEEIEKIIEKVSSTIRFRNVELSGDDLRCIAKTELWKIVCSSKIDGETYDMPSIYAFLSHSLRNKMIGYIVKEKNLAYSEGKYSVKIEQVEIKEHHALENPYEKDEDETEKLIFKANLPVEIKNFLIYYLILGWNYNRIAEFCDCSNSHAKSMTTRAIEIFNNKTGTVSIERRKEFAVGKKEES